MKTALVIALLALPALADSAGGISWTNPATWKPDAARPMRIATYLIAPAKGDSDSAECGVFYFGEGQGGSVDANIDRWVGQFEGSKAPVRKKEKLAGFDVTTVEVDGTFASSMGGPMGPKTPKALNCAAAWPSATRCSTWLWPCSSARGLTTWCPC